MDAILKFFFHDRTWNQINIPADYANFYAQKSKHGCHDEVRITGNLGILLLLFLITVCHFLIVFIALESSASSFGGKSGPSQSSKVWNVSIKARLLCGEHKSYSLPVNAVCQLKCDNIDLVIPSVYSVIIGVSACLLDTQNIKGEAYWRNNSIENFGFRYLKVKFWKLSRSCSSLFLFAPSLQKETKQKLIIPLHVWGLKWDMICLFPFIFYSSSKQCCINMKLRGCITKEENQSQNLKYILRRYKAPITSPVHIFTALYQSWVVKNKIITVESLENL